MKYAFAILVAGIVAGCGPVPPDDDGPPPPPKTKPCEPGTTDRFAMGVMVFDNPRWFKPFGEGCQTIELQSGLQGGWHVEPAVQAPADTALDDLGGEMRWEVRDSAGNPLTTDARFEMFRNFWQELEGGNAYWGDFVIFSTSQYPEEFVDTDVTIEVTLDFDDRSSLDDVTITETVRLVDEK